MPTALPPLILVLLFVALAAGIDCVHRRIPNRLVSLGIVLAIVVNIAEWPNGSKFSSLFLGCGVGLLLLLPFYMAKGMAAGDVKMMMVVGAFVGPLTVFKITLITFVIGGVAAIAIAIYSGKTRAALANMHVILINHVLRASLPRGASPTNDEIVFPSVGRMPYGPAIALATAIVVLGQ